MVSKHRKFLRFSQFGNCVHSYSGRTNSIVFLSLLSLLLFNNTLWRVCALLNISPGFEFAIPLILLNITFHNTAPVATRPSLIFVSRHIFYPSRLFEHDVAGRRITKN